MNLFAGRLDEEILSMAWQPQSKMSMAPAARYTSLQLEVGGAGWRGGGGGLGGCQVQRASTSHSHLVAHLIELAIQE